METMGCVPWRVDDDRDIAMLLPLALTRVHVKIHHLAEQVLRLTILRVSSGRDLTQLRDHHVSPILSSGYRPCGQSNEVSIIRLYHLSIRGRHDGMMAQRAPPSDLADEWQLPGVKHTAPVSAHCRPIMMYCMCHRLK
jgi:hypothetical protein